MDALKAFLIFLYVLVSFRFYFKYGKNEHEELIAFLGDFDDTECPFGISLYRLKTLVHAYRIQVQRRLPHNLDKETGILKRCEKEALHTWFNDSENISQDYGEEFDDYQTVDASTAVEFDSSCETTTYGVPEQRKYLANSLTTNVVFAYLLEVVKWPDPPVHLEDRTDSEVWSINTLSRGIFPGTLWCGFGNVAEDMFSQLGEHSETDNCCRSHDLCKPIIKAFQTRYYYSNPSIVPISHCGCDLQFYNCLLKVNSPTSRMIGKIFFNLVKMKCFDFGVRDVCTSSFLGLCRNREKKCVAVLKNNKLFPS